MKIKKQLLLKKMRRFIPLLFWMLILAYCTPAVCSGQTYQYKFNSLTVDEGLSHTDANDIGQDKLGYIWIATYFGLDRFDGYSIKRYYNKNAPLKNAFKNRLSCIYPDEEGNIWLGTEAGLQCFYPRTEKYVDFVDEEQKGNFSFERLYKPAGQLLYALTGNRLKLFLLNKQTIVAQKLNTPAGVEFSDMADDGNGLLFLTSNKGLWTFDTSNGFKNISVSGLEAERLSTIYFDNRNNLIITAVNKIFLISRYQNNFLTQHYFIGDSKIFIKKVSENKKSDYWVNTGTGMLRLDTNLNFIQSVNNKSSLHSLNSRYISKVFIDRSECLWVCTFGGGVNYCDLNQKLFYTLQHNPAVSNSLSGNHIRSIIEDGENLWIGTMANGLNLYNFTKQTFSFFNSYDSPLRLKNDEITSLTFDNDSNLWIGSGAGIEILKSNRKELWKPPGYDKFPNYVIETLVQDCYGNIWFGNHMDRFGVIWKDSNNYYRVKYYDEGFFILADKKNPQLFISSTWGLKRVTIDKEGNITSTIRYTANKDKNSLSSDYTYPVRKQNDSTYWIGTIGGGLNRMLLNEKNGAYSFKTYSDNYGIFNDVESLEIDNNENIWMGGNGLEHLNTATGKLIRYDKHDGLQGNSFKVGASWKGADGRLYFGGINGLNYFYPDQIKENQVSAQPILTDILINNKKVIFNDQDTSANSIAESISYGKSIKLSHLENNIVIFFSAMHFANPLKCRYRYKLAGFDKDWKYTDGKNPSAAYSNLNYDDYTFIVEATNDDGIWSTISAQTTITVTPPWWKSATAKMIYVLLFIAALLGIYFYQARWYRLKNKFELNALNEQKREEMHKHKEELYQQQLLFFTNVSHEFRTPLTLILGPLENLMSQNKSASTDSIYQLMYKNVQRLIGLIGELMNFKKVADSKIKLSVQPVQIKQFCDDLIHEFDELASRKEINFEMIDHTQKNIQELTGFFDIQVLEKILFNLLNNSFKYTNQSGNISFEMFFNFDEFSPAFSNSFQLLNNEYRAKKYVYFSIADSGIGISKDALPKIFDMYYRTSTSQLGSGVGLALVKSLTQMHKGDIYIYSDQGKGTEIIIGIPWGENNYKESEKVPGDINMGAQLEKIDNSVLLSLAGPVNVEQTAVSKFKKRILLVDDNQELRSFLKQMLEKSYYVYDAENGESALRIASKEIPDLILSDVMMPVMNGIEFCKIIKERFETRHIPFIILSAKDAHVAKIEGMESGADFYFTKPLSIDLMMLTIQNIFEQGEKLKERYTHNYLAEATELVHSEKDKEFFNQLLNLIEENIQDANLDVDFICEKLFISRTKLYQKIKSISDQSVAEFIRTIRLKKAIQIMTHENVAINEVVDRIGLQSSSNFSRAFKKEYGKSPLQYMQFLKQDYRPKNGESDKEE